MLQHSFQTTGAITTPGVFRRLPALLNRVRLQRVYLNAQDIYTLSATITNNDPLMLAADADFVRGLKGAFDRADHTVLSPFQVNVVDDLFRRAGLRTKPKDLAVPDEEEASPESLINNLQAMVTNNNRDDRKITKITRMMAGMLEDFAPGQLVNAARLLSMLKTTDVSFMGQLGKRAVEVHEDLSTLELSQIVYSMCVTNGVLHGVMLQLFDAVSQRVEDFKADDLAWVLQGLIAVGPRYKAALPPLVLHGLENVESLDVNVLGFYLGAFSMLEYKVREHIDIIADAIVDRAPQLTERQLVMTLQSIHDVGALSPQLFDAFAETATPRALKLDPRNIVPMMDVCSLVGNAHGVDGLMMALLDRAAEAAILLSHNNLGEMLETIALYPPAREHAIVQALGRQVKRKMQNMGPPPLAKSVYGLASLGYDDPDLYVDAALVQLRWGFKDYSVLEPILMGLVGCGFSDPQVVKMLSSHVKPMARQMTLQQVERCNTYLNRLQSEDERAFRSLADRVKVFVKEVTPDVPEDIRQLLERAAASQAEHEARQEARRAARAARHGFR